MLSRVFKHPGGDRHLALANLPLIISPVGSFSEDCIFDTSSSPPSSSLRPSDTQRQTADESIDLFEAEGLEDDPQHEALSCADSGSLQRGLAGLMSVPQAPEQLRHQFPLFGWNSQPSMPEIRSMLDTDSSGPHASITCTRCISAVDDLDSLERASDTPAALRLQQHSLPLTISTGEAAALGSRMARHRDDDDAGIPQGACASGRSMRAHIPCPTGSLSLHTLYQPKADEDAFRPPHEVVASMTHIRSMTHSLTRHKSTADRLASLVFEQTGYMCSGASSLRMK